MKKSLIISLLFVSIAPSSVFSQLLLPEFEPVQKRKVLSSEAEESMPIPFNNGQSFYYFRTYIEGSGAKTKVTGQDIWFSEMKKGEWSDPYRLFRADYLKGNNSIIGTNEDGTRVYLFNTTYKKDTSDIRHLVYLDKIGKDKWTEFTDIKIPGFKFEEKYYSFSMNKKETILLISMSPSTTLLDEDLYVSLKQEDGTWGKVINLGETINTRKFEIAPYIADDDKTLYFASNGHGGLGESDIFVSHRIGDSWTKWTTPLNLGAPINSPAIDAYFIMGNNEEVYFTSDRDSEHSNIYKTKATGKIRFAHQDALFVYKGLPAESIALEIYDLDGNLIDEVITDNTGNFKYKKLLEDGNYVIKLAEEDFADFIGGKIYLVDEEGNKASRYILTEGGQFTNSRKLEKPNTVNGGFNFKQLTANKSALVILDENDFPIDTIYTNENGKFSFDKLGYDNEFSMLFSDIDESDWDQIELYFEDEQGNKLGSSSFKNGKFSFTKKDYLPKPKSTSLLASNTSKSNMKSAEEMMKDGWNGLSTEQKDIYFDFAKSELSVDGKLKLDILATFLKDRESQKVTLVGHTDNVGTDESNLQVGKRRATSAKSYLVSKGISANRVSIDSKGKSQPINSNESEAGREKNRRVEVVLK